MIGFQYFSGAASLPRFNADPIATDVSKK